MRISTLGPRSSVVSGSAAEFRKVATVLLKGERGTQSEYVARDLLHCIQYSNPEETCSVLLSITGAELAVKTAFEMELLAAAEIAEAISQ